MKTWFKQFIPRKWISNYHYLLSQLAAIVFRFPSQKLVVIGVTGTNGKSSTVNLIAKILEEAGHKVGLVSTVKIKIGREEKLNNLKMTMPGRFMLQRLLREMVNNKCDYAVVETSSEGILQHRHMGIAYDVAVFTNLTPEHLEAHGGFDNYKKTKLKLPLKVSQRKKKTIHGQPVDRIIVANLDDSHSIDFLDFSVDEKWGYGIQLKNQTADSKLNVVKLENSKVDQTGIGFQIQGQGFRLQLLGIFDLYNAAAAITVAKSLNVDFQTAERALSKIKGIPGRLEKIESGQPFTVMVDYSPEPASLSQVFQTLEQWNVGKIIHVLGSTGGGRDRGRRPILGYISGTKSDYVVVTNEDPYDDDPKEIIDEVALGACEAGKQEGENLFKILDRREAIQKAITLAKENDLVLITGKGSEQAMVVAKGQKVPWDDRRIAREELVRAGYRN